MPESRETGLQRLSDLAIGFPVPNWFDYSRYPDLGPENLNYSLQSSSSKYE
jgi:hypothetical protein